ncbi:MAG: type III pantothenate kinase [Symbiobacteriaceae bacterium]
MLLALDVGNTNISAGLFLEDELISMWRMASNREETWDEYGLRLVQMLERDGHTPADITCAAMASVVPPLSPVISRAVQQYLKVEVKELTSDLCSLPAIRYDNPSALGTDRLVNALAGWEIYGRPQGRPVIVVDFGTATKLECVSAEGEYVGGVIAPGIRTAAEALTRRTALLQRVEIQKPKAVIGRNVAASLQSGIIFGFAGLADGLVRRLTREIAPDGPDPVVVATGGLASMVAVESQTIQMVDPHLTLQGIRLMYERNWPDAAAEA